MAPRHRGPERDPDESNEPAGEPDRAGEGERAGAGDANGATAPGETRTHTAPRRPLGEVARLFLKLGVIGFGGPAAHIAMMRDEVVRRRGWLDDAEFLDLVGATNIDRRCGLNR